MAGEQKQSERRWELWSVVGAVFLGAVLIVASIGKVLDPIVFVEQIRNEGLEGILSANAVALWALALEMGLGTALLMGVRHLLVLVPTSAMVAFFVFLTGKTYWLVSTGQMEDSYSCGCFGVFLQRTAVEAFWQDLLLLVPATLLAWGCRKAWTAKTPYWRLAVGAVAAIGIVIYTIAVPGLPAGGGEAIVEVEKPAGGAFQLSTQFSLVVDGQEVSNARILESPETLQMIILVEVFETAALLDIRTSNVEQVAKKSVVEGENATADLAGNYSGSASGKFEMTGEGLAFEFEGHSIELRHR